MCRVPVCYVSFPIRLEGLVRTGCFTAQHTSFASHAASAAEYDDMLMCSVLAVTGIRALQFRII